MNGFGHLAKKMPCLPSPEKGLGSVRLHRQSFGAVIHRSVEVARLQLTGGHVQMNRDLVHCKHQQGS